MQKDQTLSPVLKKIKESLNLIQLIGEHVVLRKAGANWVGLCPFHSERTPSFSVSESRQLYHCYGCQRGGDLVTFVMELQGVSFREAVEELADRAQIQLPRTSHLTRSQDAKSLSREKLALAHKLNRFVAAYYHWGLTQNNLAKEYLLLRGVGENLTKSFYLGAATDAWDGLANYLIQKKAPIELATELGYLRPSRRGTIDLFRNRVMFPILNLSGKVAGFGGRLLSDDGPKYLNSPESLTFQKSKLAFGLYQAQKNVREKDEVILVEGYFDVLALHSAGFENAVAVCGTALTPDHLRLFRRFASRVTVLFDGDAAGRAATERAMELALEEGQVIYGAELPKGLDPDELILQEGKEAMATILGNAKPLLDSAMEGAVAQSYGGPHELTESLKKIGGWLAKFNDPVGRSVRLQWVQEKLGVQPQVLRDAMGKSSPSQKAPVSASFNPGARESDIQLGARSVVSKDKMDVLDRLILQGLLEGGEFRKIFEDFQGLLPEGLTGLDLISYEPARQWLAPWMPQLPLLEKLKSSSGGVLEESLDGEVRTTITQSLVSMDSSISPGEFREALLKKMAKKWAEFSQRVKVAISAAEAKRDEKLQARLMKEYLDVQRKMKEFNNFYDEA